jgi:hypothetical protein
LDDYVVHESKKVYRIWNPKYNKKKKTPKIDETRLQEKDEFREEHAAIKVKAKIEKLIKKEEEAEAEVEAVVEPPKLSTPIVKKKRAQAAPGYGPAPDRRIYGCLYCNFKARKHEWIDHLKKKHGDMKLVS